MTGRHKRRRPISARPLYSPAIAKGGVGALVGCRVLSGFRVDAASLLRLLGYAGLRAVTLKLAVLV